MKNIGIYGYRNNNKELILFYYDIYKTKQILDDIKDFNNESDCIKIEGFLDKNQEIPTVLDISDTRSFINLKNDIEQEIEELKNIELLEETEEARRLEEEEARRLEEEEARRLEEEEARRLEEDRAPTALELEHIKRVQEQLKIKQEINKIKKEQKKLIKLNYTQYIKLCECSNGIIMDGSSSDANNLKDGIEFEEAQGKEFILVQDYYNKDHIVKIEEAKQMVNEIKQHFFNARNLKQQLYTFIDESNDLDKIKDTRFKII